MFAQLTPGSTHLCPVFRGMHLLHRLHERILHNDTNVAPRESLRPPPQLRIIARPELARRVANTNLEQVLPRLRVWQTNMDFPLEPPPHCRIQTPGQIRRAKDKHPLVFVPDTVHLDQKLGFHAIALFSRGYVVAIAAEGLDLVDEDYGGFVLAGHVEQCLDKPRILSHG